MIRDSRRCSRRRSSGSAFHPPPPDTNHSRMTAVPYPAPIREYGRIDAAQFEEIREACQPAVLRGFACDWPAVAAAKQGDPQFIDYLKRFRPAMRPAAIL